MHHGRLVQPVVVAEALRADADTEWAAPGAALLRSARTRRCKCHPQWSGVERFRGWACFVRLRRARSVRRWFRVGLAVLRQPGRHCRSRRTTAGRRRRRRSHRYYCAPQEPRQRNHHHYLHQQELRLQCNHKRSHPHSHEHAAGPLVVAGSCHSVVDAGAHATALPAHETACY